MGALVGDDEKAEAEFIVVGIVAEGGVQVADLVFSVISRTVLGASRRTPLYSPLFKNICSRMA
jgi:hypothetical protein